MMTKKLAKRGLRRGIGSMEYIHSLLIAHDLDEDIDFLAAGTSEEVSNNKNWLQMKEVSLISNKVLHKGKFFQSSVYALIVDRCPKTLKTNAAN